MCAFTVRICVSAMQRVEGAPAGGEMVPNKGFVPPLSHGEVSKEDYQSSQRVETPGSSGGVVLRANML